MSHWLATRREGQHADYIQRFDPRFWTVDFPRPMMAAITAQGPDGLRVDCEFHHRGELAGLIWDSVDRFDHPLIAYDTVRDYAHCVLRFRWRSSGLVALDAPNGPTLTIEGRDAAGTARTWYVRLWNYATGTPQDARVVLPFSALESGFALPGEPVHVRDIDRMFVSLVPTGYVPGGTERLPARVNGFVRMTDIACEGAHAALPIGDVLLPEYGEKLCTAYDDSYNLAPARLVRQAEALGYRGRLVHYVGMSHYYRLAVVNGALEAMADGSICLPATRWHFEYFNAAVQAGFAPIVSLSYELLAQDCPLAWQQQAWDGTYARTGWDPPSALLSPANPQAMAFLQAVAKTFMTYLEAGGGAPLFQIGEPWWWTVPQTGAPCMADPKAKAALGASYTVIESLRDPLDPAQLAMLDAAGAILAQSTRALADAVRQSASGEAECMLLTFTPTVLDPDTPEAYRANMPTGWAWPAFDRLQLEDYDWLTGGADAARMAAWDLVDARLGYPVDAQDYLAGFVLDPDDAESFWPRIDAALAAAHARGIADRFVWASPQIARDGYTQIPPMEDEMDAFDDVAYPLSLGRETAVSPEFSTGVATGASGHEHRNARWSDARIRYDVGPGIRSQAELARLLAFFRARYGPARGFRLRDPFDHSSAADGSGAPAATDQLLGTGDRLVARFDLVKRYGEQIRRITRPVAGSVTVSVDGAVVENWMLAPGGAILFDAAPAAGAQIRAGFVFDVPVRFAEDRLDISGIAFTAGEAPSVPLIELREAA